MTTNNRSRIISGEMVDGGGRVKHFNVRPYTRTSVLFIFSYPPNHIDVLFHTLYKITRNRAEFHYEVHTRVETAKKIDCLPALHHSTFLESSIINLPPIFHLLRNSVNTESNLSANTRHSP